MAVLPLSLYLLMLLYVLILLNYFDMKFLYKLSLRNEHEIRNDLPARNSFVAADSMGDAVNGYVDTMSLVESVEFVSPIVVIPSKSDIFLSTDGTVTFYFVTYVNSDRVCRHIIVRANDDKTALEKVRDFLGYVPEVIDCQLVDDPII